MSLDSYLILRYREMCGLDNISTISFDTLLKRNVSLLSTLNICNNLVNSNNISFSRLYQIYSMKVGGWKINQFIFFGSIKVSVFNFWKR